LIPLSYTNAISPTKKKALIFFKKKLRNANIIEKIENIDATYNQSILDSNSKTVTKMKITNVITANNNRYIFTPNKPTHKTRNSITILMYSKF
jgi:hypothetical protein